MDPNHPATIPQLMHASLSKCDADSRPVLFSNLVLTGAQTVFKTNAVAPWIRGSAVQPPAEHIAGQNQSACSRREQRA